MLEQWEDARAHHDLGRLTLPYLSNKHSFRSDSQSSHTPSPTNLAQPDGQPELDTLAV